MSANTNADVAAMVERHNGFTPGPWVRLADTICKANERGPERHLAYLAWDDEQGNADARLIADAPVMLALIQSQQAEITRLSALLQDVVDAADPLRGNLHYPAIDGAECQNLDGDMVKPTTISAIGTINFLGDHWTGFWAQIARACQAISTQEPTP